LVWGPAPVEEAISEIEGQQGTKWDIVAYRWIARLRALQGRLDEARELIAPARAAFEDLGNRHAIVSLGGQEGELEHLAGNLDQAAQLLRESYDGMTASGDRSFASTIAVALAAVLLDLDQIDDAWHFGTVAVDTSSSDDVMSQAGGRAVQARVLSRRSKHDAAELLAREAAEIMGRTDYLNVHGEVLLHLAQVLRESGKSDEAVAAASEALALFEQKGATWWVDKTQGLIDEWSR
jgi:tetratricopeptide (TPR) repeat protein